MQCSPSSLSSCVISYSALALWQCLLEASNASPSATKRNCISMTLTVITVYSETLVRKWKCAAAPRYESRRSIQSSTFITCNFLARLVVENVCHKNLLFLVTSLCLFIISCFSLQFLRRPRVLLLPLDTERLLPPPPRRLLSGGGLFLRYASPCSFLFLSLFLFFLSLFCCLCAAYALTNDLSKV